MDLLKVDSSSLPKSSRLSLISYVLVNMVILKSVSDDSVSEVPVGIFYYLLFLIIFIRVIWSVHGLPSPFKLMSFT